MSSVPVTIYVTSLCPYCHAALRLLDQKGVAYERIDVDGDRAKRAWLLEQTGQHTVPQVFIDGRPYGGYTDIAALDRRGALDALLRPTG
ncbi:MAG: glutaredoxin 3 [Polyangiales bacterium]|nr:glutaredoxin 3 [Myxococcales bacterium]MCB9658606.1 glutaredoxin 3 [Sandaracinaceae bacterium]